MGRGWIEQDEEDLGVPRPDRVREPKGNCPQRLFSFPSP